MPEVRIVKSRDGRSVVEVNGTYGEELTGLEVEQLIKRLRAATDTAQKQNHKPRKFGDH